MRQYTTKHTVYDFDELSKEAQDKALEKLYDINVDYEWWDYLLEDAKNIGLNIEEFNLYHQDINGYLTMSLPDVCKAIMSEHGEDTDTYTLAKKWQHKHGEDNEEEFLRKLLEEYLSILRKEEDYLTTREAIIETIEANECEFYEDGTLA